MKSQPDWGMRPWPETDAGKGRWYSSKTRLGRALAQTCCVLVSFAVPGWNSGQTGSGQESAPVAALNVGTDLQIQSSVLRIAEFDKHLLLDAQPE